MRREARFPMGLGLTLVIDTTALSDLLDSLDRRTLNTRPLLLSWGQIMRRSFAENFRRAGRPPWAPLAASTIARKRGNALPRTPGGQVPRRLLQRGELGPGTILVVSGALRDSWAQKGARGNIEELGEEDIRVGSRLLISGDWRAPAQVRPYHRISQTGRMLMRRGRAAYTTVDLSAIHEFGTATIPARPVGVIQDEDREAMRAQVPRWLRGEEL